MARKALSVTVSGFLFTSVILCGCSSGKSHWWRAGKSDPKVSPEEETRVSDSVESSFVASETEEEQADETAALSRIEEFLARTQEFEMSHMSPPAAVPLPGSDNADSPQTRSDDSYSVAASSPSASSDAKRPVVANEQVSIPDAPDATPPVIRVVSIRSRPSGIPLPKQDPPSGAVNGAIELTPSRKAGELGVDQIVEYFVQQAEQSKDFDSVWRLRFVQLALGRAVSSTDRDGSQLSQDAKRMMGSLEDAHRVIRSLARDGLLSGNEAISAVDRLQHVLADRADPIVDDIALCQKVTAFGVYEELPETSFVEGRAIQAIAYSELRNLRAERTADDQFRTLLGTRLEVLTSDGTSVWQYESGEIEDKCRRRRSDFFVAQRMTLPATLKAGNYVLKVYAEDMLSQRATEVAHPFHIYAEGEALLLDGAS